MFILLFNTYIICQAMENIDPVFGIFWGGGAVGPCIDF